MPGSSTSVLVSPLRWGILGTARIAEKIAPAIQRHPQGKIIAVASRDPARGREWAGRYEIPHVHTDYAALIDDPEIDAVYIPLPPSLHAEWTIRALQAGKHVLCEKPLANSVAAAQSMVQASRETGRLLMDGVMWRHHSRARLMREALDHGQLGPLKRITSAFTFTAGKFPADDLRFRRELGGGSLLDLGWYCVGAALWATNEVPVAVRGDGEFVHETDRSFSGTLWFPSGVVATFDCGFNTAMRKWIEFAGTQGSLVCDDFTRPWKVEKPRFWIHDQFGKAEECAAPPEIQEDCLIDTFIQRVLNGDVRDDWATESLNVQRVCAALDRSSRQGGTVEPIEVL